MREIDPNGKPAEVPRVIGGNAPYTVPDNVREMRVRMVGGGGGEGHVVAPPTKDRLRAVIVWVLRILWLVILALLFPATLVHNWVEGVELLALVALAYWAGTMHND